MNRLPFPHAFPLLTPQNNAGLYAFGMHSFFFEKKNFSKEKEMHPPPPNPPLLHMRYNKAATHEKAGGKQNQHGELLGGGKQPGNIFPSHREGKILRKARVRGRGWNG
jgi:hypothetical protein